MISNKKSPHPKERETDKREKTNRIDLLALNCQRRTTELTGKGELGNVDPNSPSSSLGFSMPPSQPPSGGKNKV